PNLVSFAGSTWMPSYLRALNLLFAWIVLFLSPTAHLVAADSLPEVVIYVANETAPVGEEQTSYDTIIEWLSSEKSPETERIVASLNLDRRQFANAVDLETSVLSLEIPKQPSSGGLVIVTNRLMREGQCLQWKRLQESVERAPLQIDIGHENLILQANPLSRADILADVVAYAAKEFAPQQHHFVLIVKSHGSGSKVITPRLAVRASETSREEILRVARQEVPEDELPLWTDRIGITKPEFVNILQHAVDQYGMHFSLVYLEACNATAHEFSLAELPAHASQLLVIRERANYLNLLYADIVQQQSEDTPFSQSLLEHASEKFVVIGEPTSVRANWPAWKRGVYFLPLVLWVSWMIGRRIAVRNASNRPRNVDAA
ncbi:MAG: hypothetical protein KDA60_05700, partial [Planctomycetales bacterium]|nr:hypothetical protein [Planctomycetales bacterium]